MRFIFFSINDFTKHGGGVIRMTGVMNELIACGHEVILISNVKLQNATGLNSNIRIVNIDSIFSTRKKRAFQALLAVLPYYVINLIFKNFFKRMKVIFNSYPNQSPIFFEYLDNSIGYWLFRNGLIDGYINDLHGIVPLEFKFQLRMAIGIRQKIVFYSKYINSIILDKKVFSNAAGFIFASKAMEDYLGSQYPSILTKKNVILSYLLSSDSNNKILNKELRCELIEKYSIKKSNIVILFSGIFKRTGGVPDLIEAFNNVSSAYDTAKLILVGDGTTFEECKELVSKYNLEKKVVFIGRTNYNDLVTYQDLADIIVCPDKQNIFSELIIHVKYLDALASGKIVINGSFKSVLEINVNESLSLNFIPSSVESLSNVLARSIKDCDALNEKYKTNKLFVVNHLTYKSNVEVLVNLYVPY